MSQEKLNAAVDRIGEIQIEIAELKNAQPLGSLYLSKNPEIQKLWAEHAELLREVDAHVAAGFKVTS